jgi:aspartyl/glutamyl-tRNA(Asn/Gln) amidotransferase C subunit
MKVTDKDVAYVADLANLELSGEERGGMLRDLNSILDYIERLNELDTSNVEPMAQVSDRYGVDESRQGSERFAYASREDVVRGIAQVVVPGSRRWKMLRTRMGRSSECRR